MIKFALFLLLLILSCKQNAPLIGTRVLVPPEADPQVRVVGEDFVTIGWGDIAQPEKWKYEVWLDGPCPGGGCDWHFREFLDTVYTAKGLKRNSPYKFYITVFTSDSMMDGEILPSVRRFSYDPLEFNTK